MRTHMMIAFTALAMLAASLGAQSPPAQSSPTGAATPVADDRIPDELIRTLESKLKAARIDPATDQFADVLASEKAMQDALQAFGDALRQNTFQQRNWDRTVRDYVFCRNAASPRLSGNIIRVGADQRFKDLPEVQPPPQPGDLVILGQGEFHLFNYQRQFMYQDMAIVGQGAQATTLAFERAGGIDKADRVRLEGLRIDCMEDPLTDIRENTRGGIHLRDCELINYNSGAGGSNALGINVGMVLLEGCLFDGSGGRASRRRGDMGDAMDLRDHTWLYARQCQFADNGEIVRARVPTVFDGCTAFNTGGPLHGVTSYPEGSVLLRDSDSMVSPLVRGTGLPPHRFLLATDDLAFIEHVLDPVKPIDDDSGQLAQSLRLHRRLPYWIGLIRHENPRVRELAAGRLKQLVDVEINLPEERQKDDERLADLGVLFACEQEYTRLITWFEANREQLEWDEAAGRYRLEEKPAPNAEEGPAKEQGK